MSEQPDGQDTPKQPESTPQRALPARTGRRRGGRLGEWVGRTLDIVEMMADATRETLLRKR
ncbi:MAG: hypothetical protein ACREOK_03555 [Gemmatimonadaceae bacterium]